MGLSSKSWLRSKTVWGLLTAAVPVLSQVYDLAKSLPAETIPHPVSLVISGVGLLLAAYGRKNTTKPLKGLVK